MGQQRNALRACEDPPIGLAGRDRKQGSARCPLTLQIASAALVVLPLSARHDPPQAQCPRGQKTVRSHVPTGVLVWVRWYRVSPYSCSKGPWHADLPHLQNPSVHDVGLRACSHHPQRIHRRPKPASERGSRKVYGSRKSQERVNSGIERSGGPPVRGLPGHQRCWTRLQAQDAVPHSPCWQGVARPSPPRQSSASDSAPAHSRLGQRQCLVAIGQCGASVL